MTNHSKHNDFKVPEGSVHVWTVNFNTIKSKLPFFSELLSEDEKLRASKFRFKKDNERFIIFRGILRFLSGSYLNLSPKTIHFEYGEYGKPEYGFETDLKFNISHAGDLAVLGFVNHYEIGIDVEAIKQDFDVLDIVDNYFSKKEIEALHKLSKEKQIEAFYRGWTRKEAFIKAKAKGLSFPLDAFSISIDSDEKAELLETSWDTDEKRLWNIIPFETESNYKAALAINGIVENVKYFQFDFK